MDEYIYAVAMLSFLVNFFLLLGTNHLAGSPPTYGRAALGAAVSGIYAGACLLNGFHFLGNIFWRCVSLVIISGAAFGLNVGALRRGILYALLNMALGGCAAILGSDSIWGIALACAVILLLCAVGARGLPGMARYVPVELRYGDRRVCLTALRDTGNMLRDPITGQSILVVGPDAAKQLTGLSAEQLRRPAEVLTQTHIPGLRLIPYHSVGQAGGLLLALRLTEVKIGSWKGSSLVAFAPDGLGSEDAYQALTGGAA